MEIFARRGPFADLSGDHSSASIREGQIVKDDRMGLSVYLAGELEIWSCLLIVLAATVAAWWLYRMETKKGTAGPLNKILPFLRATAVALIVLTLAGPTLKNVSEKGERGRVFDLFGWIESMTIQDQHMSPGRKLLLAERHGWLPQDQQLLDPTLHEAADLLSAARSEVKKRMEEPTADLNKIAADFAAEAMNAVGMLQGQRLSSRLAGRAQGSLRHEVWEGIPGSDLNSLTSHTKFKSGDPDFAGYLEQPKAQPTRGMISGEKSAASSRLPKTEPIGFGSMRTTNASSNSTTPEKTPTGPRRFFASLRTLQPIGAKLSNPNLFLSVKTTILLRDFAQGRRRRRFLRVGWTLPNGSLERPIPGKRFPRTQPRSDANFFRVAKSMNEELVEVAQSLRKGKGDTADADMRQSSFRLGRQVPFFRG